MRRAAIERPRTRNTWRKHLVMHAGAPICACEFQPGRFRKGQRIGGCGRPQCWLCHFDKLTGQPTANELRARATFAEGMSELPATNVALVRMRREPALLIKRRAAARRTTPR